MSRASAEADPGTIVRTSEPPRLRPIRRVREIARFREFLGNLIRKELKVKYTSSVLGAAWSMLNPILYLAVFSFVFTVVLRSGVPRFPVYLLSGLIAWTLFSGSLGSAVRSVVENANLVKKVYFPREILPIASIGSVSVDFALQLLVLVAFMAVFRQPVDWRDLLLLPLSLVGLLLFTTAVSLWVAAVNVRYRDTQHLLGLALLMWFWLTPIVYPAGFVQRELTQLSARLGWGIDLFQVYLLNPMADVIFGFQRALYGDVYATTGEGETLQVLVDVSRGWLAWRLGAVIAVSIALLYVFWRTFFKLSGDFAEEL